MPEGPVLETWGTLPHAGPVHHNPAALRLDVKKSSDVLVSRALPTATRTEQ